MGEGATLETVTGEPLVVLHRTRRWLKQTKTWIYHQVKWLPSEIEAHVVCDASENLEQFPAKHLHDLSALPTWRRRVESVARRLHVARARYTVSVATRIHARVLHSHFGPEAYENLPLARAARLRHVVTFYGYDVTRLPAREPHWRARYAQLFAAVDRVLCEGPHMRQELLKLGCPASKAFVQPLGADLVCLPFRPRAWSPGQPLSVLIAGSFREKKGIPYALAALGRLRQLRPELDLRIQIVGDAGGAPREQAEKQRILRAIADGGLAERVHLLGYRRYDELLEVAGQCQIFVSPSVHAADGDTEGGAPVTIVELAASGMPIVSTTHCDIPHVLRGPAAELLAPERDVEALSARLLRLVDAPEHWPQLLEQTRRDIEQRFDAAQLGRALARHYAELG